MPGAPPEAPASVAPAAAAAAGPAPVVRVLLTGGPGAGKSSALATLRDRISKRGFQAVVVPENATALLDNSGGYDPSWHGTPMHVKLQQTFLRFQMQHEDTYCSFAELRPGRPHLLLHDRGCLDGRLFCSDEQWTQVLEGVGVTEEELLKRYDLVIHMTSVAAGMENLYDYGPGSSNPARYHTPEQARHADVLAQEIYAKHPHVRVVPNFPEFSMKMEAVVQCVTEAVQVDGLAGPRERSVLRSTSGDVFGKAWPVEFEVYDIQVTFLDADFTESVRCRQLAPRCPSAQAATGKEGAASLTEPPQVLYEFRQEVLLDGRRVNTRRVLTAESYALLQQSRTGSCVDLKKRAVCFTWQGLYFEVCTYMGARGEPLPDSCEFSGRQVLDRPLGAPIPPWLGSVEEASGTGDALGVGGAAAAAASEADATAEEQGGVAETPRPSFKRQLTRNATAEAAVFAQKGLEMRSPLAKRPREDTAGVHSLGGTSAERPLKRQSSVPAGDVPERSSFSKVVAGALSPARVRHSERQPESCLQ